MQFFLLCSKLRAIKILLKPSYRPLVFTSHKDFLKQKLETLLKWFPCLIFYMIFDEKYFSCYILLTDQISLPDCLYFEKHWAICVLQLCVDHVVTSYIFK